jgi:hypothetical protein
MATMTDSALLRKRQRAGVYIYDESVCHGYCASKVPPAPATFKAALGSRIDLNVRGATLAQAGRLLASITECEILGPATRIDERRDLSHQDVSVDAAVRELQLMALVRLRSSALEWLTAHAIGGN